MKSNKKIHGIIWKFGKKIWKIEKIYENYMIISFFRWKNPKKSYKKMILQKIKNDDKNKLAWFWYDNNIKIIL